MSIFPNISGNHSITEYVNEIIFSLIFQLKLKKVTMSNLLKKTE